MVNLGLDCLNTCLDVMAYLSKEGWEAVSYANPVIWRQMETQQEYLSGIAKTGEVPDEPE